MKTHDQYNGIFRPDDSRDAGHLRIAGADSLCTLIGESAWAFSDTECADMHGTLSDGRIASLLRCVRRSQTQHRIGNFTQFESEFFPNYVVVGNVPIRSNEAVIQAVRYHSKNLGNMVYGNKTFRSLHPDREQVRALLEREHQKSEEYAIEHNWPSEPFDPEIGTHPGLLYFSGIGEIVVSDAVIARVTLSNRTSYSMGSASGIGFDNKIMANIEFREPKKLSETIRALYTLHGLFELSLGHRQRYDIIELELTHQLQLGQRSIPHTARLYWSHGNDRVVGDHKTHPIDVLLAPDRRPDEFGKVVTGWMDSDGIMGDPRERFATAFFGSYGINRIVGAANMFDLLPESRAPKKKEPDTALAVAANECRRIFKALPDSFARQSMLSALGRIGIASLRDRVYHRADKIISVAGDNFPDLYLPCNHAVLARNHYVHGSDASFNYQDNFIEFMFITNTLEFVFAASDLIDMGWDLKGWMSEGTTMSHEFGTYVANYAGNMRRLKSVLEEQSESTGTTMTT